MSESEFIDRMMKSFDYLDCIKKIVECDDLIILKTIQKLVDKEIKIMESETVTA